MLIWMEHFYVFTVRLDVGCFELKGDKSSDD